MNINAYIAALEGKKFCCWCLFKCNNAKVKGDTGDGQARTDGGHSVEHEAATEVAEGDAGAGAISVLVMRCRWGVLQSDD